MKLSLPIILVFILTLSGCANKSLDINANLMDVTNDYHETLSVGHDRFEDEIIAVDAGIRNNKLIIDIHNISSRKLLIHWNESAIVDIYGRTNKIYFTTNLNIPNTPHSAPFVNTTPTILSSGSGVRGVILNMDNEMLIPGTTSSGYLVHTSRDVYTYMPGYSTPDRYINSGIIMRNTKLKIEDEVNEKLGRVIELILAVENNGQKSDYSLLFKINYVGVLK